VIAALLSPWASSWPDGLERVAHDLGFSDRAGEAAIASPLPDYAVPALGTGRLSTAVAGVAGTVLVLGLTWGLGRLLGASRAVPPSRAAEGVRERVRE
jgi:cobalt/nickel transport protein